MSSRSIKRQRSASPPTRPASPVALPASPPKRHTSQWDEILRLWSKLDDESSLKNTKGQNCSRFVVDANTSDETVVTMTQLESSGLHSSIFSVQLDGVIVPVVLKKHMPSDDSNVSPEIEAELQQWAYKHGLAPQVKAYNDKAMLIEKCAPALASEPLPRGYEWARGLSSKRFRVNTLNTALGKGSLKMFDFILKMFDTCGLYNRDPNFDNYMYLRNKLVQIDYGQNRFVHPKRFDAWFAQLPPRLQTERAALAKQLIVNDSAFPPLFQWYEVHMHTDADKKRSWGRAQWVRSILAFKQQRQVLIHQLQEERRAILAPAEGRLQF